MKILRNPFYLMAGIYLLLAAIALTAEVLVMTGVLASFPGLGWMSIHLLTIGVVVQAILGSLAALVAAKFGGKQPGVGMTWVLWLLVNVSFGLLLYSMSVGLSALAAGAAGGIFIAITLMLTVMLQRNERVKAGIQAILRLYVAGPLFFLIGIVMAISMLLNWPAPGQFPGLLEAHVHANVWGFLGLVVAGFLLDHLPVYVGQPLRWPRLVSRTSWLLIMGAVGLVAGPWLAILPLTLLGIIAYVVGTALLLTNLIGAILSSRLWTPNLAHLIIAYLWMVVPTFVAPISLLLTGNLPTGRVQEAAIIGLVTGWILQIVIGAFPLRLRELQRSTTGRDGWWFSVVVLNIGVLTIWLSAFTPDFATAELFTVPGYILIICGWLPPLSIILKRLLGGGSATLQA
jgi:cytochrome c oxidase cbb3-type subunit I